MELFYAREINDNICKLDHEESGHCIRVLRHKAGDEISIIDGVGGLFKAIISVDSHKGVEAEIISSEQDWGGHKYHLTMAVAPTKNMDRYEWFAEKSCEVGLDRIVPIICTHSERKVIKTPRVEKILVSATKQSLKASIPSVDEATPIKDFILENGADTPDGKLRLIAYCFESDKVPRFSIKDCLEDFTGSDIIIMIGPEGDFTKEEAELALSKGFTPIHLGPSRLRTETAALTAVQGVYFKYI